MDRCSNLANIFGLLLKFLAYLKLCTFLKFARLKFWWHCDVSFLMVSGYPWCPLFLWERFAEPPQKYAIHPQLVNISSKMNFAPQKYVKNVHCVFEHNCQIQTWHKAQAKTLSARASPFFLSFFLSNSRTIGPDSPTS